jgi:hypothetical protein
LRHVPGQASGAGKECTNKEESARRAALPVQDKADHLDTRPNECKDCGKGPPEVDFEFNRRNVYWLKSCFKCQTAKRRQRELAASTQ